VAPFGSTQKLNRSVRQHKETNPENAFRAMKDGYDFNELSMKIMPEQQATSMFKSATTRFKHTIEDQPGPGQYEVGRAVMHQSRSLNVFPQEHQVVCKPTVPSIPVDNLGFREDENNEMMKVRPAAMESSAATFHPPSSLNHKGVTAWKQGKMIKRENERYPGPGDYNHQARVTKSVSSCFASASDRFGTAKKIK
jgi:hypothetical protein